MLDKSEFQNAVGQMFIETIATDMEMIEKNFDIFVKYNGCELKVNLENAYNLYLQKLKETSEDKALQKVFASLQQNILEIDQHNPLLGSEYKKVKSFIYPYLVSAEQGTQPTTIATRVIYSEINSDLSLAYVIDDNTVVSYITEHMINKWGITKEKLKEIAMTNFNIDKDIPPKKMEVAGGEGWFYYYNTHDGFDATRILLSHRIKEIENKAGIKMLVGVPNRDFMIIFPIKPGKLKTFNLNRIWADAHNMPYGISPYAYEFQTEKPLRYISR